MHGQEPLGRLALEAHHLPLRAQAAGQAIERNIVDQQREQLFVELVGKLVFVAAPFGGKPILGHQEQDRLAAGRGIFQRLRPSLARDKAVVRVKIEENIVRSAPPLADHPVAQCNGPVVIPAGMTDEQT